MSQFAVKRLAAVEVEPSASHQHELNAGALRRGLGFPEGRSEGALSVLAYVEPDHGPVTLEGTFTLYDARAGHPTRTSEYRMYYSLPGFQDLAKPGDLLVLFRGAGAVGIDGALARPGTQMERKLEELLAVGDHAAVRRMVIASSAALSKAEGIELVQAVLPLGEIAGVGKTAREHPLFAQAIEAAMLPATKPMAEAGRQIADVVWGNRLDPDRFIESGLEAESELFFAIEAEVGARSLGQLLGAGPPQLDEVLSWALSLQQSRKARRGQSLQHHFGLLLQREDIPHTPQAETERGETPDFVIPGRKEYCDATFPAERLRMVACKSTVRERWGQILKEADRIPVKYLLTVDTDLSAESLQNMHAARLMVFMPESTIQAEYASNDSVAILGTVEQLIKSLQAVL